LTGSSIKIEIICVGNELLSGITLNTNAHWLGDQISRAGGLVQRVTVVPDQLAEISSVVRDAVSRRPKILIITGGLGATYDDMTLEGVAKAAGKKVYLDPRAVGMLRKSYAHRGLDYKITPARLKMATIPQASTPLQNLVGSAPAVRLRIGHTDVFCMQGVPGEMQATFNKHVLPLIRKAAGRFSFQEANFEIARVTEAMLAPSLSRIVRSSPKELVYIKTHPRGYLGKTARLRLHITSKGSNATQVKRRLERTAKAIQGEVKKLGGTWTKSKLDSRLPAKPN
jgi:molybdenum cofactor synthesis domain-containing protein